jgi:4-hydroxy-tetrahydrodipicolinate synthase
MNIEKAKEYFGCWPTMLTPFTADNKVDFKAIKAMVEWYVQRGADGIFAVCLSEREKLDIYRRLLTDEFLVDCARKGRLVFLKDVSCANEILARRAKLVKGTALSLFNANTSTVLDSLIAGYDGYNCVMANFHIDLYKWLYLHFAEEPILSRKVSDFLTVTAIVEARTCPTCAKYHMNATGIPMSLTTRSKNVADFNENAVHEVEAIIRMENAMRAELGLPL